jgi:O-antigen/teichoic acid export membrane protein
MLARGIEGVVAVLTIAAISRHLGPSLYGDYAFIISLGTFLIGFTFFGIENIIIRDVAKYKEDVAAAQLRFGSALATRWVLSLIIILVLLVMLVTGGYSRQYQIGIVITAASQFAFASATIYSAVFKAYEKMEYEILLTLISQLLALFLVFAAIYLDMGLVSILIALAISNIARFLVSIRLCYKKFIRPKIVINTAEMMSLARESFILGINMIVLQTILRVDIFILKAFKDSTEVSLFYAPHSLLLRLLAVPAALSMALFPFFSRSAQGDGNAMQTGFTKTFNALFILGMFVTMAGMVFANQIIGLVYGKSFIGSTLSFRILLPSTIFLFLHALLVIVLISDNKPSMLMLSSVASLLVNFALDLVLIPKYGNAGASVASLAGYAALFGSSFYLVARHVLKISSARFLFRPFVGLALLSGTMYLLSGQPPFVLASASVLAFAVASIIVSFGFNPSEIRHQLVHLPESIHALIRK